MVKNKDLQLENKNLKDRIKQLEEKENTNNSVNMEVAIYQALDRCFVLGVQLEPGQRIGLTDDNERLLKVGKYAKDPEPGQETKTNRIGKIGYGWLQEVDKAIVNRKDIIDGAVFFPVPRNSVPKELEDAGIGPRPTQFGIGPSELGIRVGG